MLRICVSVRACSRNRWRRMEELSLNGAPAQSRRAGLRIRDFTAWQPVEGCDLQGSARSVALCWLTPHSSLFSCQGCHTQYSSGEELHDTAAYCMKKREYSNPPAHRLTVELWIFFFSFCLHHFTIFK